MELLSVKEAQAEVAAQLGISSPQHSATPDDQIVAEYIRQTVSDLLVANPESASGVYVTRITNHVRMQLASLWPVLQRERNARPSMRLQESEGDTQPDPIRRVLDSLEDLRELAHLGHGYWIPTPLRFVRISDETTLIVSIHPTEKLRKIVSRSVRQSWIARTIQWADVPKQLKSDVCNTQSLESWLGAPPENLESWTRQIIARAQAGLSTSASALTEFEVYAPASCPGRPQAFRWVAATALSRSQEGVQLCRATEGHHFRLRRYWLGTMVKARGEIRSEREYPVDYSDVRRIQYGLDAIANSPTIVRVRHHGDANRLTLTNLLPAEERRAIIVFGQERSVRPGRFPLLFEIEDQPFEEFILPLLGRLGIRIVHE